MILIITAQSASPISMARLAFFMSMYKSDASKAPVHAPVPGSGTPTNKIKPINKFLSTLCFLLIAFSSSLVTSFPKCLKR